jgi:4'-phosphopantetheinyl transferase
MNPDHKWTKPPEKSQIKLEEVHIWRGFMPVKLDQRMTAALSAEETQRATCFLRQEDRQRYSFSHGMLRAVLGYYLSVDPQSIVYKNNPFGKPSLWQSVSEPDICFNMAHSAEMVAVAVTCRAAVGIDVECMREIQEVDHIITRNFSPEEQRYLRGSSERQDLERFFTCWTLKEAFIKAIGMGLSYPLQTFNIINSHTGTPVSGRVTLQESTERKWYQFPFQPHPSYRAAIVVENSMPLPLFYDFNCC